MPVNGAIYKASRGTALCTQIAARQPLARAIAKKVKACHFTDWKLDDTPPWAVRLFANKWILHMQNMRELQFTNGFVDAERCNVIATLGSLEELSFERCTFPSLHDPADVEPEKGVRVKVSRLWVVDCDGLLHQLIAAIDARYLPTLAMNNRFSNHVSWL